MKNFYLFMMGAALAGSMSAQTITYEGKAANSETTASVEQTQLLQQFQTATQGTQNIQTLAEMWKNTDSETGNITSTYVAFPEWIVSCFVNSNDFKGMVDNGNEVEAFPQGVAITGLSLLGTNFNDNQSIKMQSFVSDGDAAMFEQLKTVPFSNYTLNTAVSEVQEQNLPSNSEGQTTLVANDFTTPYFYTGGDVLVNVKLTNCNNVNFQFATTPVSDKEPLSYRGKGELYEETRTSTGQWVSKNHLKDVEATFAGVHVYNLPEEFRGYDNNYLGLKENELPAYGLTFGQCDINVHLTSQANDEAEGWQYKYATLDGVTITLIDNNLEETDENYETTYTVVKGEELNNTPESAKEDYSFTKLNPNHTYTVTINGKSYGTVNVSDLLFVKEGELENQIDITIDLAWEGTVTGVEDMNAASEPVSVKYVNMAGQESNVPFSGINVVVKTMADGTRTASKVVK